MQYAGRAGTDQLSSHVFALDAVLQLAYRVILFFLFRAPVLAPYSKDNCSTLLTTIILTAM